MKGILFQTVQRSMRSLLVHKRTVSIHKTGNFLQIDLACELAKVIYLGCAGMVINFIVRERKYIINKFLNGFSTPAFVPDIPNPRDIPFEKFRSKDTASEGL